MNASRVDDALFSETAVENQECPRINEIEPCATDADGETMRTACSLNEEGGRRGAIRAEEMMSCFGYLLPEEEGTPVRDTSSDHQGMRHAAFLNHESVPPPIQESKSSKNGTKRCADTLQGGNSEPRPSKQFCRSKKKRMLSANNSSCSTDSVERIHISDVYAGNLKCNDVPVRKLTGSSGLSAVHNGDGEEIEIMSEENTQSDNGLSPIFKTGYCVSERAIQQSNSEGPPNIDDLDTSSSEDEMEESEPKERYLKESDSFECIDANEMDRNGQGYERGASHDKMGYCEENCKQRHFSFTYGASLKPHSRKIEKGGEDACFVQRQAIAVFDGVSSWGEKGIDAGLYSQELARLTNEYMIMNKEGPRDALQRAYMNNEAIGSSTANAVHIVGDQLKGLNIGDSTLIVVRGDDVVFESENRHHEFNCPYQIGRRTNGSLSGLIDSGEVIDFSLEEEDLLIMGSDGLWDNIFQQEILRVARVWGRKSQEYAEAQHGRNSGPSPSGDKIYISSDAKRCVKLDCIAHALASIASRGGMERDGYSPFSLKCRDIGRSFYGGKPDDVTVICARVVREEDPNS